MIEEWRDVVGYEGLYQVSNFGRVYSIRNSKVMKQNFTKLGYASVELFKNKRSKRLSIHRLVAIAFIENNNNLPQINHIDENPSNNDVSNLEWCTAKYNMNYGNGAKTRHLKIDYTTQARKMLAILNGKNACKPVIQKTKDGMILRCFESAKLASKTLKINASHIAETCSGKRKSAGSFVWEYVNEYTRRNDLSEFQF